MDTVRDRIEDYAIILNSALEDIDSDLLDFIVADVVDRALVYMNRAQLVASYERFIADNGGIYYVGDYYVDVTGTKQPILPIPTELERPLASVVCGVYKTVSDIATATTGPVTSISDNGQSVSFGEGVASYLSSKSDSEIFSSVRGLLDKFRIPTIIGNTNTVY